MSDTEFGKGAHVSPAAIVTAVIATLAFMMQLGFVLFMTGRLENTITTNSARITGIEVNGSSNAQNLRIEVTAIKQQLTNFESEYRTGLRQFIATDAAGNAQMAALNQRLEEVRAILSQRVLRLEDQTYAHALEDARFAHRQADACK